MALIDQTTTYASIFGRFADEWTRRDVPYRSFSVALEDPRFEPLYKEDGHFVFRDLEPGTHDVTVSARFYQARLLSQSLASASAVGVEMAGDDELFVTVRDISLSAATASTPSQNRVDFDPIEFVPAIDAGARVLGSGGLDTVLSSSLGGEEVEFVLIDSATGVSVGDTLRIVRSSRLLLRPGPSYVFPTPSSVVSIGVFEDTPSAESVDGATLTIEQVNGVSLTTVTVDSLPLHRVTLLIRRNGLSTGSKVEAAAGIVELRSDGSAGDATFLAGYVASTRTFSLTRGDSSTDTRVLSSAAIPAGATEIVTFSAFGIDVVLDESFDKATDILAEGNTAVVTDGTGEILENSIRITGCLGDISAIDVTTLALGNLGVPANITITAAGGFSGGLDGSATGTQSISLVDAAGNMLQIECNIVVAFDGTETSASLELRELANLIFTTSVSGPAARQLILGPQRSVETVSNERGEALFYFPEDTPVSSLHVQTVRPGYLTDTRRVRVRKGSRTRESIHLTPA